jgi:hypothetical protein
MMMMMGASGTAYKMQPMWCLLVTTWHSLHDSASQEANPIFQ